MRTHLHALLLALLIPFVAVPASRAGEAPGASPGGETPAAATEEEEALGRKLGFAPDDLKVARDTFIYRPAPFKMTVKPLAEPTPTAPWRRARLEWPTTTLSEHEENNTAYGIWYEPAAGADTVMLILPYWGGSDLLLEEFIAQRFARLGYAAVVVPLAYQFERAPFENGKRVRSGRYTVSSNLRRTRVSWEQSTKDPQRLMSWLRAEKGYRRFGVLGISLGAHIGALLYSVCDDLSVGVFCLAGGNLHELVWNDSTETRDMKAELIAQSVGYDHLKKWMRPFDAVYYAAGALKRKNGILMVNGAKDDIVPLANARILNDAFGNPEMITLPSDHVGSMALLMLQFTKVTRHVREVWDPQPSGPAASPAPAPPDPAGPPADGDTSGGEEF
ncbi:MAG: hypothetical protein HY719_13990 [Planctomycetes bacterium]|nr:hypothetical protein [Planctomycetota bacterium]